MTNAEQKILEEIKRYHLINNYITEQEIPPPPGGDVPPPPGGDVPPPPGGEAPAPDAGAAPPPPGGAPAPDAAGGGPTPVDPATDPDVEEGEEIKDLMLEAWHEYLVVSKQ